MGVNRILYKPCIIIENLQSGTHCYIQSLVSNRILKYSYQYLKPIRSLNSLSKIQLPLDWQRKIREALKTRGKTRSGGSPDGDDDTSGGEVDLAPIGFGSQESLFSIQGDNSSQQDSEWDSFLLFSLQDHDKTVCHQISECRVTLEAIM